MVSQGMVSKCGSSLSHVAHLANGVQYNTFFAIFIRRNKFCDFLLISKRPVKNGVFS